MKGIWRYELWRRVMSRFGKHELYSFIKFLENQERWREKTYSAIQCIILGKNNQCLLHVSCPLTYHTFIILWYITHANKFHCKAKTNEEIKSPFMFLIISSYDHSIDHSMKVSKNKNSSKRPKLLHSEARSQPVCNFKNYQGSKWDWFYFTLFYLFIFSYGANSKQSPKVLVLLSMFAAGLLIFLSSLIPDLQFSSIWQLMPLLAWLHLNSVAPVATACWDTAFGVLSRTALCFIDSDFNFKYYPDWSGTWKQMFWETPLMYCVVMAKFHVPPSNGFKKSFCAWHCFILYNINKVLEKTMAFGKYNKIKKTEQCHGQAREWGKHVPGFTLYKCLPL